MRWLSLLAFIALALFQTGGGCGSFADPCDQDRQQCAASPGLPTGVTCAAEPQLSVELGTGQRSFETLAPGARPALYYGEQGGVHTFGSVRIRGAQLDRYNALELSFSIESPCDPETFFDPSLCVDGFFVNELRTALIGGDTVPLNVTADGTVDEPGFLVFADALDNTTEAHRFRVEVRDPCDRRATDLHEIPAGM